MSLDDVLFQQNEFLVAMLCMVTLVAIGEVGYWLGRRRLAHASEVAKAGESGVTKEATNAHLGEVQTATLAVLGLLLAFSFSMAVSRFDTRKQDLVEESNAIGTAYLRVQLLPQAQQPQATERFREYTDARLASDYPDWYLNTELSQRTSMLQRELWSQGVAAAQQDPRSVTSGLYLQSLNDMFDAQSRRDAAGLNHLPSTALFLDFIIATFAVGILGYRSGLASGRSLAGAIVLALIIGLVLLIILDLDHPYQGLITISQQSLINVRQSMGNGLTGP